MVFLSSCLLSHPKQEETKPDKEGSDVKEHVYCLQPIEQLNGNNIRNLKKLVDGASLLRNLHSS